MQQNLQAKRSRSRVHPDQGDDTSESSQHGSQKLKLPSRRRLVPSISTLKYVAAKTANIMSKKSQHNLDAERATRVAYRLLFANTATVTVVCDTSTQTSISWSRQLVLPGSAAALNPGSCNLYFYPQVQFDSLSRPSTLGAEQVDILHALILALALDEGSVVELSPADDPSISPAAAPLTPAATTPSPRKSVGIDTELSDAPFLTLRDASGANATLGLLVANTPAAVALFVAICKRRPKTLTTAHSPGPFFGENAMHVLVANRREEAVLELLPIAIAALSHEELVSLLYTQATGAFFTEPPMLFFGGTPIGYAVAFSMTRTLTAMIHAVKGRRETLGGLIDFDDPRRACALTGFLPIHVAIANGLIHMYALIPPPGPPPTPIPPHTGVHISTLTPPPSRVTAGMIS